jgi:hypothetical protein
LTCCDGRWPAKPTPQMARTPGSAQLRPMPFSRKNGELVAAARTLPLAAAAAAAGTLKRLCISSRPATVTQSQSVKAEQSVLPAVIQVLSAITRPALPKAALQPPRRPAALAARWRPALVTRNSAEAMAATATLSAVPAAAAVVRLVLRLVVGPAETEAVEARAVLAVQLQPVAAMEATD